MCLSKNMIVEDRLRVDNYDILYISYDGLLDPLGKSQVLPYIEKISEKGLKYIVISFEKNINLTLTDTISNLENELNSSGILWKRLRYHKNPSGLATFYDILCGVLVSCVVIRKYRIRVVHARSYVASLIAVLFKKTGKQKFIFDMRGFWADERIEASIWKKTGLLYRLSKYFEKVFLRNADVIVSLTKAANKEMKSFSYLNNKKLDVAVIPTCVDLDKFGFNQGKRLTLNDRIKGRFLVVYSGAISTWCMPDKMLDFLNIIMKNFPNVYFLALTREKELLAKILSAHNIAEDKALVESVDYSLVSHYLSLGRVGLAFYRPGYSRIGCCPTKVGEYLACGLPVIINKGVGDTEEIIKNENAGIIIDEFSNTAYERASQELEVLLSAPCLKERCRRVAEEYFSLDNGVKKYLEIYNRLL